MSEAVPPALGAGTLTGKRVLVTGARGFLGRHLCTALVAGGASVHAISREPIASGTDGMDWSQLDCSDAPALRQRLQQVKPDVIYHLASPGLGVAELSAVLPTLTHDLVASVNMLTVASEIGFERMVLVASLEEPEQSLLVPLSPYAAAKWCTTAYANMFRRIFKAPVTLVRAFMTYGPYQRPYKVIPSMILAYLAGRVPELKSPARLVDWIYVDDVIAAMLAAAVNRHADEEILDLGTGSAKTVGEVGRVIARLMHAPEEPRAALGANTREEVVRVAHADQTFARLGWRARVSLEDGLSRTIAAYRAEFSPQ